MENQKNYYAIIPADVRYSDIPANAKLLYGEITALCNEKGFCWASNQYFAELYKKNTSTISVWIRSLKEKGFIKYEIKNKNERKIFIKEVLEKSKGGIRKTQKGVLEKSKGGVLEKSKHNNTINNNTINNTSNIAKTSFCGDEINQLIDIFYKFNPATNFGNKTERKAIDWFVKKYGFEKTKGTIEYAISIQGKNFAPTITKPTQLKNKLGELIVFHKRGTKKSKIIKI